MKPNIGELAPDFKAKVIGGEYTSETQISLADLKGKKTVLFFYPKDLTPG